MVSRNVARMMFAAAILIAAVFLLSTTEVFADGTVHRDGEDANGNSWFYDDGKLKITATGTGVMPDYRTSGVSPWSFSKLLENLPITKVEIEEGITYIGDYTFARYPNIEEIKLPATLQIIGDHAFDGCTKAEFKGSGSTGFLENIQEIRSYAFQGCENLNSVVFSEGLTSIYEGAFKNCTELTRVVIPSSVTYIESEAFQNTELLSIAPAGVFADKVIVIPWGEGNEIPDGISFAYSPVVEYVFPDGITTIPDEACAEMHVLATIELPDSVTEIKSRAFLRCYSLTEIDWSSKTNLETIAMEAFEECSSLKKVILPDQVQPEKTYAQNYGGYNMFSSCEALTEVHIPDSWEVIPGGMFQGCTSLTEDGFNWPSGVKEICSSSFDKTGIRTMEIPNTVTTIYENAFGHCENLSKAHIPASVTEFHGAVFSGCHSLITAGPSGTSLKYNLTYDWTKEIPDYAFQGSMLQRADVADGVTKVGRYAFTGCKELEVVRLPESVDTISYGLFSGCRSLRTVRLPEDLVAVEERAFHNSSLKRILFRGNAPEEDDFHEGAFEGCKIICYYPADNSTWTSKIIRKRYLGRVVWKPYSGEPPVLADRERSAVLNGGGTIKARFYLVDEDGKVIPEARFKFKRRALGKIEEFDNEYLVTDFDGGYDFSAPYIAPSDGNVDVEFYDFEILSHEDQKLESGLEFKIKGKATRYVYAEEWSFGFGVDGSANLGSGFKGKIARKDGGKIKLKHNKDGKLDLTLSISITNTLQGALANKVSLLDKDNKVASMDARKVSGSADISLIKTYKRTIRNYDPDNTTHQQQVSAYFALAFLCDKTAFAMAKVSKYAGETIDPMFTTTAANIINNMVDVTFDQSGDSVKVKVAGSGAVVSFAAEDEQYTDFTLGGLDTSSAYTMTRNKDESDPDNTKDTISTGLTNEKSFSLFSTTLLEAVGTTGLFGRSKVNDTSATYTTSSDKDEESISLSHCEFDSGFKEFVGWEDVHQYHEFTAEDKAAEKLIERNGIFKSLKNGKAAPIDPDDYKSLMSSFLECEEPVSWEDTESMENSYSLPIDLGSSDFFSAGMKLSGGKSYEVEMKNGSYANGVVYYTADSSENVRNAINDADGDLKNLDQIIKAPINMLGSWISDLLKDASGTIGRTIQAGKAAMSSNGTSDHNWNFYIYQIKPSGAKLSSSRSGSLKLESLPMRIFTLQESSNEADGKDTAVVIGEPYYIACEDLDNEGAAVEDITDAGTKLTIEYSQDEVDEATGSSDRGALAIYRRNEKKNGFDYVGGTVDAEAKTVTADITSTGEYVLAYDESAPAASNFRYSIENRTMTVDISSFSEIKSGSFSVDGEAWISGTEFLKYCDEETGVFFVHFNGTTVFDNGSHTVVFALTDEAGHESVTDFEYDVKDRPEITDAEASDFGFGGTIRLTCDIASGDMGSLCAWAEVYPDDSYDSSDAVKIYDTCVLKWSGDKWILDYKDEVALDKYTFVIYAQDKYGRSYARTVTSNHDYELDPIDPVDPIDEPVDPSDPTDPEPHEHTLEHHEAVARTCTTDGSHEYWYCTECNKYFSDADGKKEITDASTLVIKAGHIEKIVYGYPATCTTAGSTSGKVCAICGKILVAQEIIAPTGRHSWEEDYYFKATIWSRGERAYHCTECYEDKYKYYAKLKPKIKLSAKKKKIRRKKSFTLTVSKIQRGDEISSVKPSRKGVVKIKKTKKNKYKITGNKKGKTVITVRLLSGKKARCTVTVS